MDGRRAGDGLARAVVAGGCRRWLTRHRTAVTAAAAAMLVALAGTAAVLAVQTRANAELKRANDELAIANAKVTRSNADLQAANERERQRFDLAMEAIKLFHGEVSEDLLLKEKQFEGLRTKLLKGAADFYGKLEGLLKGQTDPQSRAALGRAYFELGELTGQIGNQRRGAGRAPQGAGGAPRAGGAGRGPTPRPILDVVRSLIDVAGFARRIGDKAGQRASYEEALTLAEGLVASGRGSDEARFELAECLRMMTYQAGGTTSGGGAGDGPPRGGDLRELVGTNPSATRYLEELGECHFATRLRPRSIGRPAEAIAAYEEGVAIYQRAGRRPARGVPVPE